MRPWLRLDRDWESNPKVRLAKKRGGQDAVISWLVLLGKACQSDGFFPSREHLDLACESYLTAGGDDTERVVDILLNVGLVDHDGNGYRIHDWSEYQPPMRFVSPNSRKSELRDGNHAERDGERDGDRDNVRTNERTHVLTNKTIKRTDNGTNGGGQTIQTTYPIGDDFAGRIADLVKAKSIVSKRK